MAGPDMSLLVAAVDFDTVVLAVLYIAVALCGVYLVQRASALLISAVAGRDPVLSKADIELARFEYNEAARLSEESRKRWES